MSSTLSLSSLTQYVFLASIAYVLAGAPLLSLFYGTRASHPSDASAGHHGARLDGLVFPEENLRCGEHAYRGVYVLRRDPLVVYIEGFLSAEEAGHVVGLSEPLFTPSTTWTGHAEYLNKTIRNSEKAPLPRDDVVKCIEDRARRFQGWRPWMFIEKLWTQRYGAGGHYTYHYDWSTGTQKSGRVSSFMVYVAANCTGGGTHFPRLERPRGREWCRFIECEEEMDGVEEQGVAGTNATSQSGKSEGKEVDLRQGVIFKPVARNAVFWENMRSDGTGYLESWHAGLPVKSGVKVGLNVWSWFQEGFVPPVEEQGRVGGGE
ncbi:hypothetical protein P153DRAFT_108810 [Dothidotthia symphoricarpi CBS 119687]|uniref:Prolyl 4-hydroxylase alpha subunit domain-containing protein n=1 Tax=Dothidotthia symphoricarpi CBS 119687 TaxID=1392245 RepID=A0A6A6AQK8_9PLEO|nr:uncharacterized protein P153DRAFT_108810 [Dothidotthia symphoricarpi CBS 119687]KAF2134282.1 hypothetical protein P153DRAFT_108810 [Dothidotthia symphoricarpi CBS 119687]